MILREMLRHEVLAKKLLYSDRFYTFPDHIEKTTFGVSCDAFANFKETLTRHKSMVAEYLEKNYDKVIKESGRQRCLKLTKLLYSSSPCIKAYCIHQIMSPSGNLSSCSARYY
jgi:hypothetical protein